MLIMGSDYILGNVLTPDLMQQDTFDFGFLNRCVLCFVTFLVAALCSLVLLLSQPLAVAVAVGHGADQSRFCSLTVHNFPATGLIRCPSFLRCTFITH
jgi:hypothetical protein